MKFTPWITLRYIRGSASSFLSSNFKLSLLGVFVSTSLLVVVLSVFNGFQRQIKESILKFEPHLSIRNSLGNGKIKEWRQLSAALLKRYPKDIMLVEGMIQSPAIVKVANQIEAVFLRGQEFSLAQKKRRWSLPDYFPPLIFPKGDKTYPTGKYCLIGKEMAINLNLQVGDTIELIVPRGQFSLKIGIRPNISAFRIAGLFQSGHYEYDSRAVILSLKEAQSVFRVGDQVQEIAIKTYDVDKSKKLQRDMYKKLPFPYQINTVIDRQKSFFAALAIEKVIMTTIVFLIVLASIVGVFISTYLITNSKRKEIGILKSIGVSEFQILSIFTFNGFLSGIFGTLFGICFGIFLTVQLQNVILGIEYAINHLMGWVAFLLDDFEWYNIQLIPKNIYYFEDVPYYFDVTALTVLAVLSLFLSGLASWLPARKASRLDPVHIIQNRFE